MNVHVELAGAGDPNKMISMRASQITPVHGLCDRFFPKLIPSAYLPISFLYLDVQWGKSS